MMAGFGALDFFLRERSPERLVFFVDGFFFFGAFLFFLLLELGAEEFEDG